MGEAEAARRRFEEVLVLARRSGSRVEEARALNGIAQSLLAAGSVREARQRQEQALAVARSSGDPFLAAEYLAAVGQTLILQGDLAVARGHLERVTGGAGSQKLLTIAKAEINAKATEAADTDPAQGTTAPEINVPKPMPVYVRPATLARPLIAVDCSSKEGARIISTAPPAPQKKRRMEWASMGSGKDSSPSAIEISIRAKRTIRRLPNRRPALAALMAPLV
jgi:tetratricopeptide (TPR) repeat protein